ncbi:MAG: hypothetical protein JO372_00140 [Solirubrobacterales bacterium]|nr:hypothetical protein [Solirubrobacterales bacterium]
MAGRARISEALALNQTDVDERRGPRLIRHGKGDKRREAGTAREGVAATSSNASSAIPT